MNEFNEHSPPDKSLVQDVLAGDVNACRLVVQRTEALVASIVCKMVLNKEDRKDLAQDVYLKAFKNIGGFQFKSKLSTWIAQIAYNTCLNYLKKKKLVLRENWGEEKVESPATQRESNDVHAGIVAKELLQLIQAETEKLPPVYRVLVTLYHQEDMPYSEIAVVTGLPEGTVKSYLFRARKLLRERLLLKYNTHIL